MIDCDLSSSFNICVTKKLSMIIINDILFSKIDDK